MSRIKENNVVKTTKKNEGSHNHLNTKLRSATSMLSQSTNKKNTKIEEKKHTNLEVKKNSASKSPWIAKLKKLKDEFAVKWENPRTSTAKLDDFEKVRTLGQGAYGRVILVIHKRTSKPSAIKVMPKEKIVKQMQIEHTINEKKNIGRYKFSLFSIVNIFV